MRTTVDSKLIDQARTFEVVAWIAVVTLAVHLLDMLGGLRLLGSVYDALFSGDWAGIAGHGGPALDRLIGFLPVICYVGGLVAVAEIFGRVSKGEMFSEANSKGLAKVGSALIQGAVAAAIIVPTIRLWISDRHGGFDLSLEPETWVIGVIGGAILVLGRMMAAASALRTELDEII